MDDIKNALGVERKAPSSAPNSSTQLISYLRIVLIIVGVILIGGSLYAVGDIRDYNSNISNAFSYVGGDAYNYIIQSNTSVGNYLSDALPCIAKAIISTILGCTMCAIGVFFPKKFK